MARPHISRTRSSLKIGGFSAGSLAEKYGTPLYVTDLDRVASRFDAALRALRGKYGDSSIAFAYKSNSTRDITEALAKRGAGATVVSVAGLELAGRSGVDPAKVVFDGPSKSKEELAAAIEAGVGMINAESTQEVLDIEALCAGLKVRGCRVGFRVNFGIEAATHAGLATGSREHKFGVARDEVVKFCKRDAGRLKRVELSGMHSHVGSQISDPSVFRKLAGEMASLGAELSELGTRIREFNFGGGLGIDYGNGEGELSFEQYAEATAGTFARRWKGSRPRLVFELGRSIVADSTVFLTRVNYVKAAGAVEWALVDAGMNDFLRPALYGARHEIVPAKVADGRRSAAAYDIGGPVCETTDTFGSGRRLGVKLRQGDLLAILDTGAYGISMASHYNMRPTPAVVVVSGGEERLAQASEPFR
ncbi:MAG: diaminopimelate decarboxylase [Nitrososphaerota archaeon]|nr:diaminopimelate decarboxylase [Nitrososphaerota archaeon]